MHVTLSSLLWVAAIAAQANHMPPLQAGTWRAWLDSPGGQLPFIMDLLHVGDTWRVVIHNGRERIDIPTVTVSGNKLTLGFDHYDSTIIAKIASDGTSLSGTWRKPGRDKNVSTLPFHATAGLASRFLRDDHSKNDAALDRNVTGRWLVHFSKSSDPAIALFKQQPSGAVTGTVMTTTGDYRFLEGDFNGSQLQLSVFDGAHAFLFTLCGRKMARYKVISGHEMCGMKRGQPSATNKPSCRMTLDKLKL